MSNPVGRAWKALTMPTLKMRIARAFFIDMIIYPSMITTGMPVIAKNVGSRRHSENTGKIYAAARGLTEGTKKDEAR